MMTTVTANAKAWTWSPEVLALAKKLGVEQYLDPLMEATLELFPTAREVRVYADRDVEIPDLEWITFDAHVPKSDIRSYTDQTSEWIRALYRVCPATLAHGFVLILIPEKA
jgi:hypothetical protein